MLDFEELSIKGVYLIKNFIADDPRGVFVKTFHKDQFQSRDLGYSFQESYYSVSKKNVIRGMHFQLPPYDHEKLVYVTDGEVLDVVLDLRKESETFGKSVSINLREFSNSVYVPKGCAHGFLTLSPTATLVYSVSTVYNQNADTGILWNSIGFDWPVQKPIISGRDEKFLTFAEFKSPF